MAATAAELVLDQIDTLLGEIDVELTLAREQRVDAIITDAVRDATAVIRDEPGRAHFLLEAARLRAQAVLDGSAR